MSGSWVLFLLIFISSIPIIVVFLWFRLAKYQLSVIRFLFALLAGATAVFPARFLQEMLLRLPFPTEGRLALLYEIFFRIAFTEELSRLLLLFVFFLISARIAPKTPDSSQTGADQPLPYNALKKGTAIGLVAGLGFALIESAIYGAADFSILPLRAVTAAPLHAACGSRVGGSAVLFRTNPIQAIYRLLAATAIHGVYNMFMVARSADHYGSPISLPQILAVVIALSALITSIVTIRDGWKDSA